VPKTPTSVKFHEPEFQSASNLPDLSLIFQDRRIPLQNDGFLCAETRLTPFQDVHRVAEGKWTLDDDRVTLSNVERAIFSCAAQCLRGCSDACVVGVDDPRAIVQRQLSNASSVLVSQ